MPAETETKKPSDDEIETKRAALLAQLADLPQKVQANARPGTRVGEGLAAEYIDFTPKWFEDVEARRLDRDNQGRLIWPTYQLREMTPAKNEVISVNGVPYAIYAGMQCKLPDPHYHAWLNSQKQARRNDEEFAKPDVPRDANVLTPPHKMADGPIRDRQA